MESKKRVAYFYDPEIGSYYYGPGHPMKPHRLRLTHSLVIHYGLANLMEVYRPRPAVERELQAFHADDYIHFLKSVTPDNKDEHLEQLRRFCVGEDCPVFTGLYRYCQIYTGASIGGAVKLNYRNADVVVNWMGGLHHAKKAEASGFCYINDIVLAILELLKHHARVLYVDIDIHHGDGVEEAFLATDRVLTVSLHKFGDGFFPGTGDLHNCGQGRGKGYSVNVPLKDGMTDEAYTFLFRPVMRRVMEIYQPEVIVFHTGADSLAGDRLGAFNLTMKGHADCQQFMLQFGVPMLVLGGGGYKINNVARCWAYETGRILGQELGDELPENEYQDAFAPDFRLHPPVRAEVENLNTREYLQQLLSKLMANLSRLRPPDGVPFAERPPDTLSADEVEAQQPPRGHLWDGTPAADADSGSYGGARGRGARVDMAADSGADGPDMHGRAGEGGGNAVARPLKALALNGGSLVGAPPGRDPAALLRAMR
ncbi:hypothetical protein WJX81_005680 [Elliptochloris bilobata]|uniref:Histone deacetylase n=1 Tax=Elliptochloris bilobata TaxID=381761 RepID=A0AAW1QH38_9CHLO